MEQHWIFRGVGWGKVLALRHETDSTSDLARGQILEWRAEQAQACQNLVGHSTEANHKTYGAGTANQASAK
jgi:hypothetical protein